MDETTKLTQTGVIFLKKRELLDKSQTRHPSLKLKTRKNIKPLLRGGFSWAVI
jgi:hypothetical protein